MKYIALTTAATALLVANSYGDISYSVPGLATAQSQTGQNIDQGIQLGKHWGYKVTGYSWRLVAADPEGGYHPSGGYTNDDGEQNIALSSSLNVKLNDGDLFAGSLSSQSSVTDEGAAVVEEGSVTFSEGQERLFTGKEIKFSIEASSEWINDSGSYFIVHGQAIKNAPVPTGTIAPFNLETTDSASYYRAAVGTKPTIYFNIERSGTIAEEPDLVAEWSAPVLASNSGSNGQTNNGLGNNLTEEGGEKVKYDPSNPGNANKVMVEKFDVTPPDGDYEANGN